FASVLAGNGVEHQAYRLFWSSTAGPRHARQADTEGRVATLADALRQSGGDFSAYGAVLLDQTSRYVSKARLELIRIDHGAAKKVTRAADDRSNSLCQQTPSAGFGDGNAGVSHLQIIADNLLQGIAVIGKDKIAEFLLDFFGKFIDPLLRRVK